MAVIDRIITYAKAAMTAAQRAAGATRVVAYNPTTSKLVYPDGAVSSALSPARVDVLAGSYIGPQLLTVTVGNSINNGVNPSGTTRNNSGGADPSGWWSSASEVMFAAQLCDSPLRFPRITATTRADKWGQYAYSGQTLATINGDIATQLYAALDTASVKPDLIIAVDLLANDIAAGRTTAQCKADLQQWLYTVQGRYPSARIIINTPHPSFSYDTGAKVLVYQDMKAHILGLDNGRNIFASRADMYEDPVNPGKPLAGYTDVSVHPNHAGGTKIAREGMLPTLRRVVQAAFPAYRATSLNFAATGTAAATGTNVSGTVPTGYLHSGTAAGTIVLSADQPGCTFTQTQVAGASVDAGNLDCGGQHVLTGFTQFSPYIKVRINSGAANLRGVYLQPRCRDGTTSPFFFVGSAASSDGDPYVGAYQDGDILTLRSPIIMQADAGTAGALTLMNTYLRLSLRATGGLVSASASASVTVLGAGVGLVA